ncbi:DNA helicase II [Sodalis sp. CWE]|nr:DNA helicase II [Sodalis sp. CWE]
MITPNLFKNLNDKQREAVEESSCNLLVLAGAGSGKTRVLVHRIAWLLSVKLCPSYSIMAVTFTNKAAMEMRNRVEGLIGTAITNPNSIWIGTFHGLAYRILRIHYKDANLPKDFQVIDRDDQLRLLKRLILSLNLDEKKWSPYRAIWYIEKKKDQGLRPQKIEQNKLNLTDVVWNRIYHSYQEVCNRTGLLDFTELLLCIRELWLSKPNLLLHYQKRFTNILVDEFQDINRLQYDWIRILKSKEHNIIITGDDDQSIYSWRGAQVENIQLFLKDFPKARVIRLEQNYRSTGNILRAANILIANNNSRLGKTLWTNSAKGEPISLYCAFNEFDEAYFVTKCIKEAQENGRSLKDYAILYRNNYQSRIFEESMLRMRIPYRIYGGTRFFERQEIKDVLSYLRLIVNRNDDVAYERIANRPSRGLGERTINIIRQIAHSRKITLWQSSLFLLKEKLLIKKSISALQKFLSLIDVLSKKIEKFPLNVQIDLVIKNSGLWNMYKQEKGEKGQSRINNLKELVSAACQFRYLSDEDQNLSPLQSFLIVTTLQDVSNRADLNQDAVQLMTFHSSKGLEFHQVFMVGMEEGIFPSQISLNEPRLLEEERRLAYVGITRAMDKLTITYTKNRRLYGEKSYRRLSRFINELPIECIERIISKNINYTTHV